MPIEFKTGNLFESDTDAIVNTVNCVGVMGKGVALEFKRRWPENYKQYRKLCDAKALRPGNIYIFDQGNLLAEEKPRYLINFPTKDHWRAKSKIEYIEDGLETLREELLKGSIRSISMPPLGCGNGGLEWSEVKSLIVERLNGLETRVVVYEPFMERDAPEHTKSDTTPLTFQRASLLKVLGDIEIYFEGGFDRLSLQKITYFLQEFGIPFGLKFSKNKFGPYSERLKDAFRMFERQELMAGFSEDMQISHVTKFGYALSDEFLSKEDRMDEVSKITRQISELIEGFESPYGLELLSSVHYLCKYEKLNREDEIISALHSWSTAKSKKFSEHAVRQAHNRLTEDRLLQ